MTVLEAVEGYVRHMRHLGFRFITPAGVLRAFSRHVGEIDFVSLDEHDFSSFLNKTFTANGTWVAKHALLRNFCFHWQVRGFAESLTMPNPRPRIPQDFTPYIYSRSELQSLFRAASRHSHFNHVMDSRTLKTILIFLYATGARLTEAVKLRQTDINLSTQRIDIPESAISRQRTIPIGSDLLKILRAYSTWKDKRGVCTEIFFAQMDGSRLLSDTVYRNFRHLLAVTKISRRDGVNELPRLYDLRATFAVHRITSWIKRGANLGRLLPALSAYLGQKDLSGTERFLTLTPERFTKELNKLSPGRDDRSCKPELLKYLDSLCIVPGHFP